MLVAVGRAAKNTGGLVLGYEVNGLCHRVNCMVSDDVALRRDTQRDRSRVTTRMHVPGPLFGDFFYTDRAEI